MPEPLRLHIGGKIAKEGWKIFNIQPGPNVDYVGNCLDLAQFPENSVAEIYASHVLEHLNYHQEAHTALRGFHRVLAPGGRLMIGVPDLDTLCYMMLAPFFNPEVKYYVMSMLYGGQTDPYNVHKAGYNFVFLSSYLSQNGFERVRRVKSFGVFADTTERLVNGIPISLNVEAFKPA